MHKHFVLITHLHHSILFASVSVAAAIKPDGARRGSSLWCHQSAWDIACSKAALSSIHLCFHSQISLLQMSARHGPSSRTMCVCLQKWKSSFDSCSWKMHKSPILRMNSSRHQQKGINCTSVFVFLSKPWGLCWGGTTGVQNPAELWMHIAMNARLIVTIKNRTTFKL